MKTVADRSRFLAANAVRFRIAEWCALEPISRETIAERLGRTSGSLSAPKTLLKHGALVAAGRGIAGGGGPAAQLFRLNPAWESALSEARRLMRPAYLESGTELLLIPLAATQRACGVLANDDGVEIAWGARLDGEQAGLILSPHRGPDGRATIRTVAALADAGVHPVRLRLRAPMAAEELRRWSLRVAGENGRQIGSTDD